MLTIHGKGGHARVVADAYGRACLATDDAEGTRPDGAGEFICAVGDNKVRQRIGGNHTVIHPAALLSRDCEVGRGVYIGAKAVLGPCAVVADGAIVNTAAVVEHDCEVGAFAHIAPGAILCGGVKVGKLALVGAGAVVIPGVTIGEGAIVGAGSVVLVDVPAGEKWAGNPAHKLSGGAGPARRPPVSPGGAGTGLSKGKR